MTRYLPCNGQYFFAEKVTAFKKYFKRCNEFDIVTYKTYYWYLGAPGMIYAFFKIALRTPLAIQQKLTCRNLHLQAQ